MSPKKDLDNYCNGNVKKPHRRTTVKGGRFLGDNALCRYVGKIWVCTHYIKCENCDRILKHEWDMKKEDCPGYSDD